MKMLFEDFVMFFFGKKYTEQQQQQNNTAQIVKERAQEKRRNPELWQCTKGLYLEIVGARLFRVELFITNSVFARFAHKAAEKREKFLKMFF
jgi:hypothetical protein